MTTHQALSPARLRTTVDPETLGVETTEDLEPLADTIGQERAVEAVRLGVAIRREGYNIFALGPSGTGRHTLVRRQLEDQALKDPAPDDWVYVNNFADTAKPRAIRLAAGGGKAFRDGVARLVDDLQAAIRNAFESEDYQAQKQSLEAAFAERQEALFAELQEKAAGRGASLMRTQQGLAFAPVRDGEVIGPEEFQKLPPDEQESIKETLAQLEGEMQQAMKQVPQWMREVRDRLRQLNHQVSSLAVDSLMAGLIETYADNKGVLTWLDDLRGDIVGNVDAFIATTADMAAGEGEAPVPPSRPDPGMDPARRYAVNLIIDNAETHAAPVVYEDHPSYANLMGRVEQQVRFGAVMTDFNLIKPGALHRANGGYLILDATRVVSQPHVWEELKRTLRARQVRIQSVAEAMGMVQTMTLEPQPIPLDVKIIMVGPPQLYYMLASMDADFGGLFKVTADFDDQFERSDEHTSLYARLIATILSQKELRPLDAGAVAAVIDHSARLAADSERLTLRMRPISDLLEETDFRASEAGRDVATVEDVATAIDGRIHRVDRVRERSLEQIDRGTMLIETDGTTVGQVNGLSVLQMGHFSFGKPTRITARVRPGRGEVVDIEREVDLGGPLHSKGVLILSGFIGERFGVETPLALSASLVFEQSYGGVDGDSASSTEIYALLSALSEIPIRQGYAVTGSVNQRGEVQAIGGVNEKIEGFFDVCAARGLTGEQGVLIPESNVKHLMLREDIVAAAEEGKFAVHAVSHIDQGIEILTGVSAGARDDAGAWPADSINGRVAARLQKFAERLRAFARSPDDGNRDG